MSEKKISYSRSFADDFLRRPSDGYGVSKEHDDVNANLVKIQEAIQVIEISDRLAKFIMNSPLADVRLKNIIEHIQNGSGTVPVDLCSINKRTLLHFKKAGERTWTVFETLRSMFLKEEQQQPFINKKYYSVMIRNDKGDMVPCQVQGHSVFEHLRNANLAHSIQPTTIDTKQLESKTPKIRSDNGRHLKDQPVFEIPKFDEVQPPVFEIPKFDKVPNAFGFLKFDEVPNTSGSVKKTPEYSPFDAPVKKPKRVNVVDFISFIIESVNKNTTVKNPFPLSDLLENPDFLKSFLEYFTRNGITVTEDMGIVGILKDINIEEDAINFLKERGYKSFIATDTDNQPVCWDVLGLQPTKVEKPEEYKCGPGEFFNPLSWITTDAEITSFLEEKGYKVTKQEEEEITVFKPIELTEEGAISFLKRKGYDFYDMSIFKKTNNNPKKEKK